MQNERADMLFTNPPYNVKIDSHICGRGSVKHRGFAMATGELLVAGRSAFTELKNLVVWNKSNGGMGAFYRSNCPSLMDAK